MTDIHPDQKPRLTPGQQRRKRLDDLHEVMGTKVSGKQVNSLVGFSEMEPGEFRFFNAKDFASQHADLGMVVHYMTALQFVDLEGVLQNRLMWRHPQGAWLVGSTKMRTRFLASFQVHPSAMLDLAFEHFAPYFFDSKETALACVLGEHGILSPYLATEMSPEGQALNLWNQSKDTYFNDFWLRDHVYDPEMLVGVIGHLEESGESFDE